MKNYKILIDGFNLGLSKGSGIKYYTQNLIILLNKYFNIKPSVLFGFDIVDTPVKEVDFMSKLTNNVETIKKTNFLKSLIDNKIIDINLQVSNIDQAYLEQYLKNNYVLNYINIYNNRLLYKKSMLKTINLNVDNKTDIFHCTYPLNINIKNSKKITTIHDVIPFVLPDVSLENKNKFFNLINNTIKTSDKIITISESSKQDILKWFDISPDKIVNTYQSINISEFQIDVKKNFVYLSEGFQIKNNEYFLFVGNIEPKKNVGRVIQAFLNINTDKKLVIVGKKAWLWEDLLKGSKAAIEKGKIVIIDYASRKDLIALYKNAFFFIFPSLYEGFGLPPLEAMACKCPVITSNTSSLPEVCDDAAIYCDPYNIESIINSMEKALNMDIAQREELIAKGIKRVEFFNEKDYTNKVLNVYKSVL